MLTESLSHLWICPYCLVSMVSSPKHLACLVPLLILFTQVSAREKLGILISAASSSASHFFSFTASDFRWHNITAPTAVHTFPYRLHVCLCKLPPTSPPSCSSECQWIIVSSAAIPESLVALYLLLAWHRRTGAVSRWCHFVWVVLRCDFAAFGCWQGIKDFCWHEVALF